MPAFTRKYVVSGSLPDPHDVATLTPTGRLPMPTQGKRTWIVNLSPVRRLRDWWRQPTCVLQEPKALFRQLERTYTCTFVATKCCTPNSDSVSKNTTPITFLMFTLYIETFRWTHNFSHERRAMMIIGATNLGL